MRTLADAHGCVRNLVRDAKVPYTFEALDLKSFRSKGIELNPFSTIERRAAGEEDGPEAGVDASGSSGGGVGGGVGGGIGGGVGSENGHVP